MKIFSNILLALALLAGLRDCSDNVRQLGQPNASSQQQKTSENTTVKASADASQAKGSKTESTNKTSSNADSEQDIEDLEVPAPLTDRSEIILRRVGYTASYNKDLLIPNWVAWHLTADHCSGPAKRKGIEFHEDEDVPAPRVDTYDYMRSGYDRGHLCPAGDNKWSVEAMEQSFLMTNICPQSHGLNVGDWNEMENQCRKWAEEYGDIYIVAGPILYRGKHKRIGEHKVTVPEAFFKVVLCMRDEPKAIGFIYKNEDGNRPKGDYVNSVDQVERITGIDFFAALPDKVEKKVEAEADLSEW
jgi:endonuclease G